MAEVIHNLSAKMSGKAIIVSDVGQHQMVLPGIMRLPKAILISLQVGWELWDLLCLRQSGQS